MSAKRKYLARPNGSITNAQAELIGEAVDLDNSRAAADVDRASARKLVEAASKKQSPLHALFEWDDAKAATAQRLDRARKLIGSVMVMHVELRRPSRAYHSIKVEPSTGRPKYVYKSAKDMNVGERDAVGSRYYAQISSMIDEIEAVGLASRDTAWREIVSAVRKHKKHLGGDNPSATQSPF